MFNQETAGTNHMTFSVGYFPPGEGLKSHIHPESEEVYYVVRGNGNVYMGEDGSPLAVSPDTAIYVPPGELHGLRIRGRVD